jgi:hypothetical protein
MIQYPPKTITIKIDSISGNHEDDRNKLRKLVIEFFAKENAGKGKGELASKNIYYVETLATGDRLYLTRPSVLYKGFDFRIGVENQKFKSGKRKKESEIPTHQDILSDLAAKKTTNPEEYPNLVQAIEEVYLCHDTEEVLQENSEKLAVFKSGLAPDLILKIVKWLFIEQDINFWSWSGRTMLMNYIKEI